jgi:hypothetical protein
MVSGLHVYRTGFYMASDNFRPLYLVEACKMTLDVELSTNWNANRAVFMWL